MSVELDEINTSLFLFLQSDHRNVRNITLSKVSDPIFFLLTQTWSKIFTVNEKSNAFRLWPWQCIFFKWKMSKIRFETRFPRCPMFVFCTRRLTVRAGRNISPNYWTSPFWPMCPLVSRSTPWRRRRRLVSVLWLWSFLQWIWWSVYWSRTAPCLIS